MVYAIICGSWLRKEQGEPALYFNRWQKTCPEVVQTLGESRSNWLLLWANSVSHESDQLKHHGTKEQIVLTFRPEYDISRDFCNDLAKDY